MFSVDKRSASRLSNKQVGLQSFSLIMAFVGPIDMVTTWRVDTLSAQGPSRQPLPAATAALSTRFAGT